MAQPRTFEGHMDWEFTDKRGPLDPHSPFTQLANQNKNAPSIFRPSSDNLAPASPSKPPPSTPYSSSKQPRPPQSSIFSPAIRPTSATAAPPFRNPAFTTPRRPFDDAQLSEASGPDTTPARAGAGSLCPDTPDTPERLRDLEMDGVGSLGTGTPSRRVDKNLRYGRDPPSAASRRLHMSGRGEIERRPRDFLARDVMRKRRRHGNDHDVMDAVRGNSAIGAWHTDDSGSDQFGSDSDQQPAARKQKNKKAKGASGRRAAAPGQGGLWSALTTLGSSPDAPERMTKWALGMLNTTVLLVVGWAVWELVSGIRHDMMRGIEADVAAKRALIAGCQESFLANRCDDPVRDMREACARYRDCMSQEPDAHFRFKIFARHFAEVVNELSGTLHLKAWLFFFSVLLIFVGANVLGRRVGPSPTPTALHPPAGPAGPRPSHEASMLLSQPTSFAPYGMWIPHDQANAISRGSRSGGAVFAARPGLEADEGAGTGTDTDSGSPEAKSTVRRIGLPPPPVLHAASTSSSSSRMMRSPTRQERGWSPIRRGSPTKYS